MNTDSTLTSAAAPTVSAVPRPGLALFLIVAAQFVLQLDFSIVNIALPTIKNDLDFGPAQLQWVVTGYALTFGSLLLFGGRIGDRFGHRRVLLAGLALFAAASLLAGLAPTALVLIIARFAQGASGAFVAPQALAILAALFSEGPARTRALGIFAAATAGGASAGVVLGGICTEYIGWRAVFLVNPPIILVLSIAIRRFVPLHETRKTPRLDVLGPLLATTSIAVLIFGLSQGQEYGFTNTSSIAALALSVVLGVAFGVAQSRSASPMVPPAILVDPERRAGLTATALLGAIVVAYVYFVSLYLQNVLDFSPLVTGLCFVPATATVITVSTKITRRVLPRWGVRRTLLTGLGIAGLGQVWLASISTGGSYQLNVLGGILLTACGMGLTFPTASVAITARVEPNQRGLAGGLFVASQQVGQAIGLAALATVANALTRSHGGALADGYELVFAICIGIAVLAVCVVALLTRRANMRNDS